MQNGASRRADEDSDDDSILAVPTFAAAKPEPSEKDPEDVAAEEMFASSMKPQANLEPPPAPTAPPSARAAAEDAAREMPALMQAAAELETRQEQVAAAASAITGSQAVPRPPPRGDPSALSAAPPLPPPPLPPPGPLSGAETSERERQGSGSKGRPRAPSLGSEVDQPYSEGHARVSSKGSAFSKNSTLGRIISPAGGASPYNLAKKESFKHTPHDLFSRVLNEYTRRIVMCPCCFMLLYLAGLIVLIRVAWRPFALDTDFSAFIKADGAAMRHREAYMLALSAQKGLDSARRLSEVEHFAFAGESAPSRMLSEMAGGDELFVHEEEEASEIPGAAPRRLAFLVIRRELTVIFAAKSDNALDERVLREMRDFENKLRNMPEWVIFCETYSISSEQKRMCDPGESFGAFAWPSESAGANGYTRFDLEFDANGKELMTLPALLAFLGNMQGQDLIYDRLRYFPKDYSLPTIDGGFRETSKPPVAIRSKFSFLLKIADSTDGLAVFKKNLGMVKTRYSNFITDDVFPVISTASQGYKYTNVYYSGDVISGYEVNRTLLMDIFWALGSICFVTAYLWWHTGSLLLAIGSFFIIFISIPVAYVLTPAAKTTIASFLSVFLITGIGCDVVFVFVDFWEQSEPLQEERDLPHDEKVGVRLAFMMRHGGRGCLATSLTTSVSFFANLASVLQPLREFGLFMGLCVMSAYLFVCLFLPPLLAVKEGWREKKLKRRVFDLSLARPGGDGGSPARLKQKRKPWCCQSQNAKGKKQDKRCSQALFNLVGRIARCECYVVLATALLFFVFAAGFMMNFEFDTGVPEIFPADHNQVAGKAMAEKFASVVNAGELPSMNGATCKAEARANRTYASGCIMEWCDAAPVFDEDDGEAGVAECFRGPMTSTTQGQYGSLDDCSTLRVETTIAALRRPGSADWNAFYGPVVRGLLGAGNYNSAYVGVSWSNSSLAIEDWETGRVDMTPFFSSDDVLAYPPFAGNASADPPPDPAAALGSCSSDEFRCPDGRVRKREAARSCEFAPCLTNDCVIQAMCFLSGPRKCSLPGWRSFGTRYNATSLQPLSSSAPSRRLPIALPAQTTREPLWPAVPPRTTFPPAAETVPANQRIDITVLYGIRPLRSTPLVGAPPEQWTYDPHFDPSNPWAQRAMLAMCTDMPEHLLVVRSGYSCWVDNFRSYQLARGARFPSRNFDGDFVSWYQANQALGQQHTWVVDRKMKACKMALKVNVRNTKGADELIEYMKLWDAYVDGQNAAASETGNNAYHTANAWVRAEANVAIIGSTADTILLSAVCGCLGMLIFTGDPWLSFLVLMLVIEIITGLAFFMVVIMEWGIGPIEVISLVVFVGYSVTYALHIAHDYSEAKASDPELIEKYTEASEREKARLSARQRRRAAARGDEESPPADPEPDALARRPSQQEIMVELTGRELRVARTRMALLHVGGATFSSAVSTVGSSMFLLRCTLNIFGKLGAVVISVTVLSITFALVALPAILILMGPGPEPCHKVLAQWVRGLIGQAAAHRKPPPPPPASPGMDAGFDAAPLIG